MKILLALAVFVASTVALAQTSIVIPTQTISISIPAQNVAVPTSSSSSLPAGVTVKNDVWTFTNPPIVPGLTMGTQPVVSTQGLPAGNYIVTVAASGAASYSALPSTTGFLAQNCPNGVCTLTVVPFPPTCAGGIGWAGTKFPCLSSNAADLMRGPGTPVPLPPPTAAVKQEPADFFPAVACANGHCEGLRP